MTGPVNVGLTESCAGGFFWDPRLKNELFFLDLFRRDFLFSARCSTAADSASVEAAVRTVLRRSSGSIDPSSSSSVTSSSVGGRLLNMAQREGGILRNVGSLDGTRGGRSVDVAGTRRRLRIVRPSNAEGSHLPGQIIQRDKAPRLREPAFVRVALIRATFSFASTGSSLSLG